MNKKLPPLEVQRKLFDVLTKSVELITLIDELIELGYLKRQMKNKGKMFSTELDKYVESTFEDNEQLVKIYDQDLLLEERIKNLPIDRRLAVVNFLDEMKEVKSEELLEAS